MFQNPLVQTDRLSSILSKILNEESGSFANIQDAEKALAEKGFALVDGSEYFNQETGETAMANINPDSGEVTIEYAQDVIEEDKKVVNEAALKWARNYDSREDVESFLNKRGFAVVAPDGVYEDDEGNRVRVLLKNGQWRIQNEKNELRDQAEKEQKAMTNESLSQYPSKENETLKNVKLVKAFRNVNAARKYGEKLVRKDDKSGMLDNTNYHQMQRLESYYFIGNIPEPQQKDKTFGLFLKTNKLNESQSHGTMRQQFRALAPNILNKHGVDLKAIQPGTFRGLEGAQFDVKTQAFTGRVFAAQNGLGTFDFYLLQKRRINDSEIGVVPTMKVVAKREGILSHQLPQILDAYLTGGLDDEDESIDESKKLIKESFSAAEIQKLHDIVKNNSKDIWSLAGKMQKAGFKTARASTSPMPGVFVKKGNQKFMVVNKNYAEDPDAIYGELAVGIAEEIASNGKTSKVYFVNEDNFSDAAQAIEKYVTKMDKYLDNGDKAEMLFVADALKDKQIKSAASGLKKMNLDLRDATVELAQSGNKEIGKRLYKMVSESKKKVSKSR